MIRRAIALGSISGFVAGVATGIVLHQLWVLPALSLLLARPPAPETGWLVHLVVSVVAGILFGIAVHLLSIESKLGLLVAGLVAGALTFLLVPITLVPKMIGLQSQFPYMSKWAGVGLTYLAFGGLMGIVHYTALQRPVERRV